MASRRKFSDEYKREAVRLATEPGVTKSQVGRELGINANMLGRWCRDYLANGGAAFPGQDKPRDEDMAPWASGAALREVWPESREQSC